MQKKDLANAANAKKRPSKCRSLLIVVPYHRRPENFTEIGLFIERKR